MTSTTMLTTLDLITPVDSEEQATFSTVVLSSDGGLVTQSAPSTPIQHREQTNAEFQTNGGMAQQQQMMTSAQKLNNDFYRVGIGSLRDGIFACFRPVWTYFGRSTNEIQKTPDEADGWEIPFENILDLEWVSAGSQGAVFKGVLDGRIVAVKKVNRLKDTEIKHLRHLSHKNIIDFYGICTKAPCYSIVMQYCPNGQLCSRLRSEIRINKDLWSQWISEIADGMDYLHSNHVVHRDLKSPNILIDENNSIKICDFGTSRLQNEENGPMTSFCGTVSWMAPEMVREEQCNEKVDIYSFGVVLWEMMTREIPYANIDQMAIIFGVGNNILSLPLPPDVPQGFLILIKQCLSLKGRNRPSFSHIRKHWNMFKSELESMTDDQWNQKCDDWKQFAKQIVYPSTVTKRIGKGNEVDHNKERKAHLNHINDIRCMYEKKLKRTNEMYEKLQGCFSELKLKENELEEWEKELKQREQMASPRSSRYFHVANNPYTNECYEIGTSDEEFTNDYSRGSPYRCSQGSNSSGVPSSSHSTPFSRQSSSRSSSGVAKRSDAYPQFQQPKMIRNDTMRHSSSYWETVRGSPARGSGVSQDSGMGSGAASCTVLTHGAGQPMCFSQTLYRNGDGRWSDGRIASRRRPSAGNKKSSSTPFQRDSPSRLPHGSIYYSPRSNSKMNRSSYPSRNMPHEHCGCQHSCCRSVRAKSIAVPNRSSTRSPTPYDNPTELNVSCLMPESTSYDEALKSAGEMGITHDDRDDHIIEMDVERQPELMTVSIVHEEEDTSNRNYNGYDNPIYTSPITTYHNPLNVDEEGNSNEMDLMSSMDSRRSRHDDADVSSADSSTDDDKEETNGNSLNISINSSKSSKESEDDIMMHNRYQHLMDTSQSTMVSSLERSLEIGAAKSDGLSDNERKVKAVKKSIKGHRRTYSNPQTVMHQIIDESLSSSISDDSDAAAVEI